MFDIGFIENLLGQSIGFLNNLIFKILDISTYDFKFNYFEGGNIFKAILLFLLFTLLFMIPVYSSKFFKKTA